MRDEFRQLVSLLERAAEGPPPTFLCDGELRVRFRTEGLCQLQADRIVLLLTTQEFLELTQAAQQAVAQLDRFLASGAWDRDETQEIQGNPFDQLHQIPFSQN
jgi:hypothetical protein